LDKIKINHSKQNTDSRYEITSSKKKNELIKSQIKSGVIITNAQNQSSKNELIYQKTNSMKKIALVCALLMLAWSSCDKKSTNCGLACATEEELLFQTGFNNTTLTNGAYENVTFSGIDAEFSEKNNWDEFVANPSVGYVEIGYEDGEDHQRIAQIVPDPDELSNQALSFKLIEPHIKEGSNKKGRVQLSVNENQCIKEIYQTVRLKLHPDLAYLMEWEQRMPWFTVFEFWNNATWSNEKKTFRVTVNLFKDAEGPVDEIHFHAKADHQACNVCEWKADWEEEVFKPEFDFKFHSDRLEKLEFEKKQRSNSGLFRVVLTKKSCFSMRKYR
jgi:hypothetical protein